MKSSAKYWVILARSNLTAIDTMISVRNVACWPVKQPDRASRVGLASVRDDNRNRIADLKRPFSVNCRMRWWLSKNEM